MEFETSLVDGTKNTTASDITARVIQVLRMDVEQEASEEWPLKTSRVAATARTSMGDEAVYGYGSGASPEEARLRAVMECAERYAQFGRKEVPPSVTDSFESLMGDAISPDTCGLYSFAQYAAPNFGFVPFTKQTPLEWLEVTDMFSGARRLLPVEFIYPKVCLMRSRLVAETSSGTAAHVKRDAATLAALCEVIERDGMMLFWYRQPQTQTISIDTIPVLDLRDEFHRLQAMGFVVTICRVIYDLDIPCFLILALKGESFAYGLGCHPDWRIALTHAATELGRLLRWLWKTPSKILHRSLFEVHTPSDHYALYNRGPLHATFRQVLSHVLRPAESESWSMANPGYLTDVQGLEYLRNILVARSLHGYACDLTPPLLADCGAQVMRVLVPGLIPIHFGYNRIRLGCHRLWAPANPGRLSTLLPHFMT